jgi:hypothetical protein
VPGDRAATPRHVPCRRVGSHPVRVDVPGHRRGQPGLCAARRVAGRRSAFRRGEAPCVAEVYVHGVPTGVDVKLGHGPQDHHQARLAQLKKKTDKV